MPGGENHGAPQQRLRRKFRRSAEIERLQPFALEGLTSPGRCGRGSVEVDHRCAMRNPAETRWITFATNSDRLCSLATAHNAYRLLQHAVIELTTFLRVRTTTLMISCIGREVRKERSMLRALAVTASTVVSAAAGVVTNIVTDDPSSGWIAFAVLLVVLNTATQLWINHLDSKSTAANSDRPINLSSDHYETNVGNNSTVATGPNARAIRTNSYVEDAGSSEDRPSRPKGTE